MQICALQGLASTFKNARKGAAQVVASIALLELPKHRWENIITVLTQSAQNPVLQHKVSALETLWYICEEISFLTDEQVCAILTALVANMAKEVTDDNVRLLAVTALGFCIRFCAKNFQYEDQKKALMDNICENCKSPNSQIRLKSVQCMLEVVRCSYDCIGDRTLEEIAGVTFAIIQSDKGEEVTRTNAGGKIVSRMVPEKAGKLIDVVTGHNNIEEYLTSEETYLGSGCGRYGNRIAGGKFELDGVVYDKLAINNGPNNLHGGIKGFNSVMWDMQQTDKQTVVLKYSAADGEEGFPGKLDTTVTYHLTNDNEVVILYHAVTDKPTVLNLTNHSYFNLSGQGDPSVYDHQLTINADYYLPTDNTSIPYGPKAKVEGTPMDFRTPHAVGGRIDEDVRALNFGQ